MTWSVLRDTTWDASGKLLAAVLRTQVMGRIYRSA